jgi:hypothetical protein
MKEYDFALNAREALPAKGAEEHIGAEDQSEEQAEGGR